MSLSHISSELWESAARLLQLLPADLDVLQLRDHDHLLDTLGARLETKRKASFNSAVRSLEFIHALLYHHPPQFILTVLQQLARRERSSRKQTGAAIWQRVVSS